MLDVRNIDVFYGDVQVLFGVSLQVRPSEIVALVGANAAGKSTTLKTISGLLKPKNGEIFFRDQPLHKMESDKIVDSGIIHVPEGRRLFPRLSVEANLELGSFSKRARAKAQENLKKMYEIFPRLYDRKDQLTGSLSGGEQQMCAIARGLMAMPEVLMLDETSLGLSPLLVKHTIKTIKDINELGTTILLIDQNVNYALQIAHRAYVLENGRMVMQGDGNSLLEDPYLKKAYLGI
ncbi:ABC transporter ATP-binding protein [Neobacillus sp. OS1-2]|uniref:ABC transporter ATP-binding protein n=1 Tax=Neobacillus sp. OS1-2 TaxID=3070680 RepID=UPI0027E01731|nr:ABC transporter ATP-binding protein [Neobacillus sp. OS1-2]WML39733.1 ABC transporter ATP-binding protein [Neobacillus sp. OS1-2]